MTVSNTRFCNLSNPLPQWNIIPAVGFVIYHRVMNHQHLAGLTNRRFVVSAKL
jgi:hypothetical protein